MLRKRFSILQKYCCEHPQRPPRKRDSAFPYSEANVSLDKEESLQQGPLFSPTPQKLALSLAEAVKRKFFSFNRPGFTYGLCGRLTILGLWNCPDPACFQAKMPHQIGHIWKTTTATPFLLDRSHRFSPPAPEKWWCWTARKGKPWRQRTWHIKPQEHDVVQNRTGRTIGLKALMNTGSPWWKTVRKRLGTLRYKQGDNRKCRRNNQGKTAL